MSQTRSSKDAAVRSPQGLEVTATTATSTAMPVSTSELLVVPRGDKTRSFACGHVAEARFAHIIFGEVFETEPRAVDRLQKCGHCLLNDISAIVIRCAKCGFAIFPRDPVALYANDAAFESKPWKRTSGQNHESVLGCMRSSCCPSGGFFAGHWDGDRFRPQFDGKTMAEQVMAGGGAIFFNVGADENER